MMLARTAVLVFRVGLGAGVSVRAVVHRRRSLRCCQRMAHAHPRGHPSRGLVIGVNIRHRFPFLRGDTSHRRVIVISARGRLGMQVRRALRRSDLHAQRLRGCLPPQPSRLATSHSWSLSLCRC